MLVTTQSFSKDGYKITWTADGENYRYVIQGAGTGHIYQASHGSACEERCLPTTERLEEALMQWFKIGRREAMNRAKGDR